MTCNSGRTFVLGSPTAYGTLSVRYIKPVVRINGMVQDAPQGMKLNPCYLPMDEIASTIGTGTAQTFQTTSAPATVTDNTIPTAVIGADTVLLGEPATWIEVTAADGMVYKIPAFT